MTQKSMSFDDAAITVKKHGCKISFWFVAVDRMKDINLNEKVDNCDCKKIIFIIMIQNDTPKSMTEQQKYHERNREEDLEKVRRYYEERRKVTKYVLDIY